jgi:two-component system sensor histidine kinase UhpB
MSPPRILIVEDERITAMEVQAMLEEMNYEVTEIVDSGTSTLKSLECDPANLVLMDIRLNGELNGVETTRKINDRFEDVPVIYFSAHSDDQTLQNARETEPAGFLIKPITKEDLRSSIEMALGPSGKPSSSEQ